MTFNTTSYLAGVGSVVVILSTGFAGGYFLANPTRIDPPNRLQRLAAEDHAAKGSATQNSASVPVAAKPEVAAAVPAAKPQAVAAATPDAPAVTAASPAAALTQPVAPVEAKAPTPPVEAKAAENASEKTHALAAEENTAPASGEQTDPDRFDVPRTNANKARAAEAKLAERRKRSDARKVAEQQRKQRELEVATVAVRRLIHNRDAAPDVVIRDRNARDVVVENDEPETVAPDTPRFGLFDQ
jgi:type IV secretory pathway VirB10-like protein